MRGKVLFVVLVLATLITSACAAPATPAPAAQQPAQAQPQATQEPAKAAAPAAGNKIKVLAMEYDQTKNDMYKTWKADFEKANPGTEVEIVTVSWDQGHDRLVTWIAGNQAPDLSIVANRWILEFVKMDALEPFDTYIDDAFKGQFEDRLLKDGTLNGKQYGIPVAASAKMLYYRQDLLEKAGKQPPKTWDELVDVAKAINNPPNVYGFGITGKKAVITYDNYLFFLFTNGGDIFERKADGSYGKCMINDPAGVEALQFYIDLANKEKVTPDPLAYGRDELQSLYKTGNLGMIETGPWFVGTLKQDAPDMKFGLAPLPYKKNPATLIVTDSMVMFKQSKNKDLAMKFLKFIYQDTYREQFFNAFGFIPVTKGEANTPSVQKNESIKAFADQVKYGVGYPNMEEWPKVEEVLNNMIAEALLSNDAKAAADKACTEIEALRGK